MNQACGLLKGPARCAAFLAILSLAFAQTASAALTNRFVVKNNGVQAEPYDTWANAAADIQTAINYAQVGETVLVAAATYDTGGVTNYPAGTVLTNRVAIWKAVTVQSADNDPANTVIMGAKDNGTNGPASVRCVYMTNGSALIGFTLTNGATLNLNYPVTGINDNHNGGGVWCTNNSTAIISNCVIAANSAANNAGGAYNGNLFNCTLAGNSAENFGGGALAARASNCTLIGNTAVQRGGGAYQGWLYNSMVISNTSVIGHGGGTQYAFLYSCTVMGNTTVGSGGGIFNANQEIFNCLVIGNKARFSGGVYGGSAYNSTIVGNYATDSNGGIAQYSTSYGKMYNCIVYFNDAPANPNYGDMVIITNCCTTPLPAIGAGNIDSDPLFIANGSNYGTNHVAGNYRLGADSPCINSGLNGSWTTSQPFDLDGRARIRYGTADIGAYEKIFDGTIFSSR